ncbi:MAG: allantoinase AllB [Sandaracinaceae bacterium]
MRALISERVVVDDRVRRAAVVIDGERIHEVIDPEALPDGMPREELGSLVLMSGLVDTHVHLNDPGRAEWEGFPTATSAAASGGVTTLVDMPLNCIPVTTNERALAQKRGAADGRLDVDVGYWGGVVPAEVPSLAGLGKAGVLGAKAFMCHSGIDDFPASDEATLRAAMIALRDAGVPLLAHAELEHALPAMDEDEDRACYRAWLERRPASFEDRAIELLIRLCREIRCPVHVVHLSSAGALPMIARAKDEGLPITCETCPHYLCITAESIPDRATHFKCAPPIRGADNREALWGGVLDGTIDFVVTDHSPCTPHLKGDDFVEAWGGIASLSLGLMSVWTEASARGASVADLSRWMSATPARFAGLGAKKGRIAAGYDADLVLWDDASEHVVSASDLRFHHPISPYVGRALKGRVRRTWLRGEAIFDGDDVARGRGRELLHRGGT